MSVLGFIIATILTAIIIVKFIYPPIWKDILTLKILFNFLRNLKKAYANRQLIVDRFEQHAKSTPDKVFILYKDESYSYRQVDEMATMVARAMMSVGVSCGDTVALIMSNEPAYLWIYLGSQKIGARLSMINHHHLAEGLQRSIDSCFPKIVIVGDGVSDYLPSRVEQIQPRLQTDVPVYSYNPPREGSSLPCFSHLMEIASSNPIDPSERAKVKLSDPSVFIYTSGTTGFPKPAIIVQKKSVMCSLTYSPVGFKSTEVMYVPLPLYHASAMNLAVLNVIQEGATLVLKDKFSATQFWTDCVRYDVTVAQYVGEMLRYLINTPECPEEKQHNVWALAGNGLRLDIWRQVKERFNIQNIFEFYGSTELPAGVTNYFGIEGSVGRLSPFMSRLAGQILVDVDEDTQQPYRDATGRCRLTKPGGYGIFLARLSKRVTFEGYLGAAEHTSKCILKDVLQKGDYYVNSCDVFTIDKEYNVYFKDRLGDSYRWKGENVATTEVSSIINNVDYVLGTNVYGVKVPGNEGKAGMAAITLKDGQTLDDKKVDELGDLCKDKLPSYARPRFLRFQREMNLNSTFKQLKVDLIKEGFDVNVIKEDPVFYLDGKKEKFFPLDASKQKEIIDGRIAL